MAKESVLAAKKILMENLYLSLASVGVDSMPWVTPLLQAHDEKFNFYWVSTNSARHVNNLKANAGVSFVVFDSHAAKRKGRGVYVEARVSELTSEEEVAAALAAFFGALGEEVPATENFLGEAKYRIFKAVPEKVWVTPTDATIGPREEITVEELTEE